MPISLITCGATVGPRAGAQGLVEAGLHEDEAEFGSDFEDALPIAFGAGGIVQPEELAGNVSIGKALSSD
jgi:hypothetical protein